MDCWNVQDILTHLALWCWLDWLCSLPYSLSSSHRSELPPPTILLRQCSKRAKAETSSLLEAQVLELSQNILLVRANLCPVQIQKMEEQTPLLGGRSSTIPPIRGCVQELVAVFANVVFFFFLLFTKEGNPRATRLCNITMYGEIKLENVTVGNCNQTLKALENQVCHMAHVLGSWKSSDSVWSLCSLDT